MFNIIQSGAHPNSDSLQTKPIQEAIDSVANAGGGTVLIPAGIFRAGMLTLRSHVTLHLDNGAILKVAVHGV